MEFSTGAVKELLQDIQSREALKDKKDLLIKRATEISKVKQRDTVGAEDVEKAAEEIEEEN